MDKILVSSINLLLKKAWGYQLVEVDIKFEPKMVYQELKGAGLRIMGKKICTEENYQKLMDVIKFHKDKKGCLMPILNECQKIFGCIPLKIQQTISDELKIPLGEIYGVVTFYSQFSLEPKGDYVIGVCLGTACYVKGAQKIMDEIVGELDGVEVGKTSPDGKYTLEATRCIGACGLAPVMTVNEDVYGRLTPEEVEAIIAKY